MKKINILLFFLIILPAVFAINKIQSDLYVNGTLINFSSFKNCYLTTDAGGKLICSGAVTANLSNYVNWTTGNNTYQFKLENSSCIKVIGNTIEMNCSLVSITDTQEWINSNSTADRAYTDTRVNSIINGSNFDPSGLDIVNTTIFNLKQTVNITYFDVLFNLKETVNITRWDILFNLKAVLNDTSFNLKGTLNDTSFNTKKTVNETTLATNLSAQRTLTQTWINSNSTEDRAYTDFKTNHTAYMNQSNGGYLQADRFNTTGADHLSIYEDMVTSSSGIVQFADAVIQLFAPMTELYVNTIITLGKIEAQTENGHYWLATKDGFDIGLINGTSGTGITNRGMDFFLLDDSGAGWANILRMYSNGDMEMIDGGNFIANNYRGLWYGKNWTYFPSNQTIIDINIELDNANKTYVDNSIASNASYLQTQIDGIQSGDLILYFLNQSVSDIASNKSLRQDRNETEVTLTGVGLGDGYTKFADWITEPNFPYLNELVAGTFIVYVDGKQTGGTKTTQYYFEVYKTDASGNNEVFIENSTLSSALTGTRQTLTIYSNAQYIPMNVTDRLKVKGYAYVSGGGSAPTVEAYIQGESNTRIEIPIGSVSVQGFARVTDVTGWINSNASYDRSYTDTRVNSIVNKTYTGGDNISISATGVISINKSFSTTAQDLSGLDIINTTIFNAKQTVNITYFDVLFNLKENVNITRWDILFNLKSVLNDTSFNAKKTVNESVLATNLSAQRTLTQTWINSNATADRAYTDIRVNSIVNKTYTGGANITISATGVISINKSFSTTAQDLSGLDIMNTTIFNAKRTVNGSVLAGNLSIYQKTAGAFTSTNFTSLFDGSYNLKKAINGSVLAGNLSIYQKTAGAFTSTNFTSLFDASYNLKKAINESVLATNLSAQRTLTQTWINSNATADRAYTDIRVDSIVNISGCINSSNITCQVIDGKIYSFYNGSVGSGSSYTFLNSSNITAVVEGTNVRFYYNGTAGGSGTGGWINTLSMTSTNLNVTISGSDVVFNITGTSSEYSPSSLIHSVGETGQPATYYVYSNGVGAIFFVNETGESMDGWYISGGEYGFTISNIEESAGFTSSVGGNIFTGALVADNYIGTWYNHNPSDFNYSSLGNWTLDKPAYQTRADTAINLSTKFNITGGTVTGNTNFTANVSVQGLAIEKINSTHWFIGVK